MSSKNPQSEGSKNPLSEGSLPRILKGQVKSDGDILQVLSATSMAGTSSDRYRIVISDGEHWNGYALLGSHLNHLIHDGTLGVCSIIKVYRIHSGIMEGKVSTTLLSLEVLQPGNEVQATIGTPVCMNSDSKVPGCIPDNSNLIPISFLAPYWTGLDNWTVRARVTHKSEIESHGESEFKCVFYLADESADIKVEMRTHMKSFYEKHESLKVGKVYYVSNADLQPTYPYKRDSLNNLRVENIQDLMILFTFDTKIAEVRKEDASTIPSVTETIGYRLQEVFEGCKKKTQQMKKSMVLFQREADRLQKENEEMAEKMEEKQKAFDLAIADRDLAIAKRQHALDFVAGKQKAYEMALAEMEEMQEMKASTERALECICCFTVKARVVQCVHGHLICEPCKARLTHQICPMCRTVYQIHPIRSRVAEDLGRVMKLL